MYIYYVYKSGRKDGQPVIKDSYVGQDTGSNQTFNRMLNHARVAYGLNNTTAHDGAADLMRKYSLSGLYYRFYFDYEHYGLGDKAFQQFSQLWQYNGDENYAELNFAEVCHILMSNEPNTAWANFAKQNIQIGGYQCSFTYKNSAIVENILNKLQLNEPLKNKNFTSIVVRPFDNKNNIAKLLNPEGYAIIRAIIEQASYNLFNPDNMTATVRRHWRQLVNGLSWAAPKGNSMYGRVVFDDESIDKFAKDLARDLINGVPGATGHSLGIKDYIEKFNSLPPEDRGGIIINRVEDVWNMRDAVRSLAEILADRVSKAISHQVAQKIEGIIVSYKAKNKKYTQEVVIKQTVSIESMGRTFTFQGTDINAIINKMSQRQYRDTVDNNIKIDWNIRRKYYIKNIDYSTKVEWFESARAAWGSAGKHHSEPTDPTIKPLFDGLKAISQQMFNKVVDKVKDPEWVSQQTAAATRPFTFLESQKSKRLGYDVDYSHNKRPWKINDQTATLRWKVRDGIQSIGIRGKILHNYDNYYRFMITQYKQGKDLQKIGEEESRIIVQPQDQPADGIRQYSLYQGTWEQIKGFQQRTNLDDLEYY